MARLPRDKIAVGQAADPHRDIDMALDQVDHLIRQHQPDRHLGIGVQKGMDDRRDMELAEHDRRGDEQFAARGAIFAARSASPRSSSSRPATATKASPASVRISLRLVRTSNCAPRCATRSDSDG